MFTRKFSSFVLRNPRWTGGARAVVAADPALAASISSSSPPLHAIPATLDTFLAMHLSQSVPDAHLEPSPPNPRARQSMWATKDENVIFFEISRMHEKDLERHWDVYQLDQRIGCHTTTRWGPLHRWTDYRE